MCTFQLEMHAFDFEMHKTADFHSNLSIKFWELVTGGYQENESLSMKWVIERRLSGMVILW